MEVSTETLTDEPVQSVIFFICLSIKLNFYIYKYI